MLMWLSMLKFYTEQVVMSLHMFDVHVSSSVWFLWENIEGWPLVSEELGIFFLIIPRSQKRQDIL